VVGLLAFGLLNKGGASIEVGDKVPDKVLPGLEGDGTGSIAKYRGDWVLVNLWASWCGPCRAEAPVLESFFREHRGEGVTVLGINVQDNSDDALDFVGEFGSTYPQLRSVGEERSEAFGSTGVPENFLVNPKGRVALVVRGPIDDRIVADTIEPIIEGGA
jgi:cytochrome c biogenesis protein CcmG/thiol:disulfide interchange protein DsbE